MSLTLRTLFETSHGGHKVLRPMEGLRGFAVFLVFLVHYLTFVEPWIKDLDVLSGHAASVRALGNVGVDHLVILSFELRSCVPCFDDPVPDHREAVLTGAGDE